MDVLMVILRVVHIVLGVLWVGWTFSLVLFVEPAVRAAGPAGSQFMQAMAGKTRLVQWMSLSPLLVIITGLWMFWEVSGNLYGPWMTSAHGLTLTIGAVAGIAAFAFGLIVMRPTSVRIGVISAAIAQQGTPPTEEQKGELGKLAATLRQGGRIAGVLLLISVVLMAAVRYVA